MKKFLQILAFLFCLITTNQVNSQCSVTNVLLDNLRYQVNGSGTFITIDVTFTASTNGGNKLVFFHVWKDADYPDGKANLPDIHPTPFNCEGNQSVAPAPVRVKGQNENDKIDILDNAFLNFGFNINNVLTTFSTAGIITNYSYDASVLLDYTGIPVGPGVPVAIPTTIKKEVIDTDNDRIFIQDLRFFIPGYFYNPANPFIQVRGLNWATNGTDGKPQCWGCGATYTIGDPEVSGSVSCAQPGGGTQPTYSLFINSRYDDPNVAGTQTISGNYTLYVDLNKNNVFDEDGDADAIITTATNFTTTALPVEQQTVFKSSFAVSAQSFTKVLDAGFSGTVFAKVIVTTTGYLGAGVVGSLPNNCAPLPVSLKSFNATQRNNKAFLTWETDQENNNDGFEVERRSAGNSQYQKIGFVDSKAPGGTGAAYSYSFDDNQSLAKGVTYYRLRQVDLDGRATYSEVKAVRTGNGGLLTISIYPNPNRGAANVTIPESAGKMDVSLDDYTGKSIQRWSGISVRNLQLNNMRPGIYMLRINFRETGETITERIIVQ